MKRRKQYELFLVLLILIFLIGALSIYFSLRKKASSSLNLIKIYYFDPITKELVPEEHEIKGEGDYAYYRAFELLKTPKEENLFPVIFNDTTIKSLALKDKVLEIDLKVDEEKLKTLTLKREYAFAFGLANTFTEFKEIESIKILINSKEAKYLSHYVDISSPLSRLQSNLPQSLEINLYFPTFDLDNLAVERREIPYSQDPVVLLNSVLNELFSGSRYGFPNIFDKGLLKSFTLKSGGIASVSLDRSKLPSGFGSNLEKIFVLSIVNSLTEFKDVEKVEFLVDGEPIDTLFGSIYLREPVKRFLSGSSRFIIPYYHFEYNGNDFYVPRTFPVQNPTVEGVFEKLKNPEGNFESRITKGTKLEITSIENGTIECSILLDYTPSSKDLDIIKREIALSFTEIPTLDTIKLNIGEEIFILKR